MSHCGTKLPLHRNTRIAPRGIGRVRTSLLHRQLCGRLEPGPANAEYATAKNALFRHLERFLRGFPDSRPAASDAPGCAECGGSGVKGRVGLFELVEATEPLRELILARATPGQIAEEAARAQIGDLPAEGRRFAEDGVISRAENAFHFATEADVR